MPRVPAQGETALREDTGEVRTHDQAIGPIVRFQDQRASQGGIAHAGWLANPGDTWLRDPVTQEHQLLHLCLAGRDDFVELIAFAEQFERGEGVS